MGLDLVVLGSTTEWKESRMFSWTITFASECRETLSMPGKYWVQEDSMLWTLIVWCAAITGDNDIHGPCRTDDGILRPGDGDDLSLVRPYGVHLSHLTELNSAHSCGLLGGGRPRSLETVEGLEGRKNVHT